jgi:predicted transcriptional regulator
MANKHSFTLRSEDRKRDLPRKIIIGQQPTETIAHVLLKLMAFVLFYRDRLQIDANLHMDSIPFVPDLVELDYELRPKMWVECGECGVAKLDKLAVKVPSAEIWVIKRSFAAVDELMRAMERGELRRDRYNLAGFDEGMFDEMCGLVSGRNELTWVMGTFDPPEMQFDFNGLWFDTAFKVVKF